MGTEEIEPSHLSADDPKSNADPSTGSPSTLQRSRCLKAAELYRIDGSLVTLRSMKYDP